MLLDEECKSCLYGSQMKKVESTQTDAEKLRCFRDGVNALCENPPSDYCAPLLMRDIDGLHRNIFGTGIDYTREKSLFNRALLCLEDKLYAEVMASPDPVCSALKFAMSANYTFRERLKSPEGTVTEIKETPKGYFVTAVFDE